MTMPSVTSPADLRLTDLRRATPAELERLFGEERALEQAPRGVWRGHVLRRLDNPGARAPASRAIQWLMFEAVPWGIDFDRRRWFFLGGRRIAGGHFELRAQRSRWRDTTAFGLHYHPSRLPGPIKRMLYDELKPVGEGLLLGIGGENAERDRGDHFWFALEPAPPGR